MRAPRVDQNENSGFGFSFLGFPKLQKKVSCAQLFFRARDEKIRNQNCDSGEL
jgi:hypothetical protein